MCQVLRPQPCQQPSGADGRGCRCHRGAVNRRARYAAHPPYIPRRWCGIEYRGRVNIDLTLQRCARNRGTPHRHNRRSRHQRRESRCRHRTSCRNAHHRPQHPHDAHIGQHTLRFETLLQRWRRSQERRRNLRVGPLQRRHRQRSPRSTPVHQPCRERHLSCRP